MVARQNCQMFRSNLLHTAMAKKFIDIKTTQGSEAHQLWYGPRTTVLKMQQLRQYCSDLEGILLEIAVAPIVMQHDAISDNCYYRQ